MSFDLGEQKNPYTHFFIMNEDVDQDEIVALVIYILQVLIGPCRAIITRYSPKWYTKLMASSGCLIDAFRLWYSSGFI